MKKKLNIIFSVITAVLMILAVISCTGAGADSGTPPGTTPGVSDDGSSAGGDTNTAPTGAITPVKAILIGESISVTATATDADGDSLTYAWTIESKPEGSVAAISGADTLTASFTPDKPGDYGVKLTVSDGTTSVPLSGTLKVVGFAIGVNNSVKQEIPELPEIHNQPAVLHNSGVFTQLDLPEGLMPEETCSVQQLKLNNGSPVTGGLFAAMNMDGMMQPVYWKGTSSTPVDFKPENISSYSFLNLEISSENKIHAIFSDNSALKLYWTEAGGYDYSISASPAWTLYEVLDVACIGTDVYQIGGAGDKGFDETYFMAKNLDEIRHEMDYSALTNIRNNSGVLFVPGSTDAGTKAYVYGSRMDEITSYSFAAYITDGSGWTDLSDGIYIEGGEETITYMASLDDYIIEFFNGMESTTTYKVYKDNASSRWKSPPKEQISNMSTWKRSAVRCSSQAPMSSCPSLPT